MGHVTNDPEKFCIDLTGRVIDLLNVYFDFDVLDSYERKQLRSSLEQLLERTMDIGEEAFDSAFQEGEDKGREEGRKDALYDFKAQLRDFINDL